MAYIEPDPTAFVARFPEFDPVDDARIQLFLDDAILEVGGSWLEDERARAQMLLVAHRLTLAGEPARSIGSSSDVSAATVGNPKSISVGQVSVEFESRTAQQASGGGAQSAIEREYQRTTYGIQFLEIRNKNFFPILAI